MNIRQIRELKQELEAALQKAFSDFHNKTGVGVCGVEIAPHRNLAGKTLYTTVTIDLESL